MNTSHCYPKYVILQAVYFKLSFTLSYCDVEEIVNIRGCDCDRARSNAGFISLRLSLRQRLTRKGRVEELENG